MGEIKQILETNTRPVIARELPPNALCIPLTEQIIEFIEISNKVANRILNLSNNCNLTTCRYNENGKCTNEEKRKECVEVSRKVLCLSESDDTKWTRG